MKTNKIIYLQILTVLFILSIVLKEVNPTHVISIIIMSLLTLLAGFHIFKKAISDIRFRIIGIDLLVTLAVVGAFIIGDYFEAAAVTYLFTLGHYLELKSLEKTRSAIKEMMDLKPSKARVLKGVNEEYINVDELDVHDILLVKPGEKIPTDGVILEGVVLIDEQMMTGESIPVEKQVGDSVIGSTLVSSGYVKMKVTSVGEDTTLARMIHMVEEAQDKKARTQKFMERFSKYYTPSIVALAIAVFIFTLDIRLAITILVIACPGALVIATPVSFVAGIGNAAKKGILFKGGESIEALSKAKVLFLDKTGTLTKGKPELQEILTFIGTDLENLRLAAIGESYSEHPLSKAIIEAASSKGLLVDEKPTTSEFSIGKGITFVYNKSRYYLGNQKIIPFGLDKEIEESIEKLESKGMTVLIFADEVRVLSLFGVRDALRSNVKELLSKLKKTGITKTVMLTGDRLTVATSVAKEAGVDEVYASLLPEDKMNIIHQYKENNYNTVFVGDGINDALALSTADSSVAIGGMGNNLVMETADVVLMAEDISRLEDAIKISKKVKSNMLENIAFALLVVFVLLLGVLTKQVTMSIGMLVHEVSVLLVLINAMRLLRYDLRRK